MQGGKKAHEHNGVLAEKDDPAEWRQRELGDGQKVVGVQALEDGPEREVARARDAGGPVNLAGHNLLRHSFSIEQAASERVERGAPR